MVEYLKQLLRPYRKYILVATFYMVILSAINMVIPLITQVLIDKGVMDKSLSITIRYVMILLAISIVSQVIQFMQNNTFIKLHNDFEFDLEQKAFEKILRIQLKEFSDKNFSTIFSEINFNIENIVEIVDENFFTLVVDVVKIIGGIIGLFIISYKLALIILLIVPIKLLVSNKLTSVKSKVFQKLLKRVEELGIWYGDIINGIEEIKLWNLYDIKKNEYSKLQKKKMKLNKKSKELSYINMQTDEVIQILSSNLIYILGVIFAIKGEITLGGLIAFEMYSGLVIQPISTMLTIKYLFANIRPSVESYKKFMDYKEENANISKDSQNVSEENNLDMSSIEKIVFKNVKLDYGEKEVLRDINLTFKRGEKIAIVGENGSGKSSLINLLIRFYTPTEGNIYFDDIDIQNISLERYRDALAVMNQQTYLFNTTIEKNINLLQDMNQKEILEKSKNKKILDLINFINLDDKGMNKEVGFKGSKLSGGEKQKVALVRTLLKRNATILILDEATANYDIESENIFNKVIKECNNYSFVFVITHRPEILMSMDKIVVMNRGKVIKVGKYSQLIQDSSIDLGVLENKCI